CRPFGKAPIRRKSPRNVSLRKLDGHASGPLNSKGHRRSSSERSRSEPRTCISSRQRMVEGGTKLAHGNLRRSRQTHRNARIAVLFKNPPACSHKNDAMILGLSVAAKNGEAKSRFFCVFPGHFF